MCEGDLVHWQDREALKAGIVLEVFPSNVYEPESCLILLDNSRVVIDSKQLSKNRSSS